MKIRELLDVANAVSMSDGRQKDFAGNGLSGEHAVQGLENASAHFLKWLV